MLASKTKYISLSEYEHYYYYYYYCYYYYYYYLMTSVGGGDNDLSLVETINHKLDMHCHLYV